VFVTSAVKLCVFPSSTVIDPGVTVTTMEGGGG
jgi:hypothetical protein